MKQGVGPLHKRLRGREITALRAVRARLGQALGPVLVRVVLLDSRVLPVDPAAAVPPVAPPAAAAPAPGGAARPARAAPPPPPPRRPRAVELLVVVARRDVFVDAHVDEAVFAVSLEHGALVAPLVLTEEELLRPEFGSGPFGTALARGEEVAG
ncbi:MAG: hypothetical protein KatS3mg102_2896 [Planctomycetota bacterium]|nr:MAG: hypothetical protein KatS3mg102_2896 [Planctomycetota bacterium]